MIFFTNILCISHFTINVLFHLKVKSRNSWWLFPFPPKCTLKVVYSLRANSLTASIVQLHLKRKELWWLKGTLNFENPFALKSSHCWVFAENYYTHSKTMTEIKLWECKCPKVISPLLDLEQIDTKGDVFNNAHEICWPLSQPNFEWVGWVCLHHMSMPPLQFICALLLSECCCRSPHIINQLFTSSSLMFNEWGCCGQLLMNCGCGEKAQRWGQISHCTLNVFENTYVPRKGGMYL